MEFCPECESLLDFPEKDGELTIFCKTCGFTENSQKTLITQQNYLSSSISNEQNRRFYIYDPTFPVTSKYVCPNETCLSKTNENKREAIFFNDENSMKKVFICKTCKTEWKY